VAFFFGLHCLNRLISQPSPSTNKVSVACIIIHHMAPKIKTERSKTILAICLSLWRQQILEANQ
jgi:hypothetical protein